MKAYPKNTPLRDKQYQAWVRQQPCLVCYQTPCQAHHHRSSVNSGIGIKPGDDWCVPLCASHHSELHWEGVKIFSDKYEIDFLFEILKLRRRYKNEKSKM